MAPVFEQVQPSKLPCIECLKYFKLYQVRAVIQEIPCLVENCKCNILNVCKVCWFKFEYQLFMRS